MAYPFYPWWLFHYFLMNYSLLNASVTVSSWTHTGKCYQFFIELASCTCWKIKGHSKTAGSTKFSNVNGCCNIKIIFQWNEGTAQTIKWHIHNKQPVPKRSFTLVESSNLLPLIICTSAIQTTDFSLGCGQESTSILWKANMERTEKLLPNRHPGNFLLRIILPN